GFYVDELRDLYLYASGAAPIAVGRRAALGPFATAVSPITYSVARSVDGVTLAGTITTDGTIGRLFPWNVVSSRLTLTQGSTLYLLVIPGPVSNFVNVFATSGTIDIGAALSFPTRRSSDLGFYVDELRDLYLYASGAAPIAVGRRAALGPFA